MSVKDTRDAIAADAELKKYLADPTYQAYIQSGRITPPELGPRTTPKDIQAHVTAQLNEMKAQDKTISQYYELATGKKADPAVVAQFSQYANDPALLSAAIGKFASTAPQQGTYNDAIQAAVQDKLGRAATEAELGYFGKQMEQGNLDAYGLGEFLGGTTEYQTRASDTARTKLAGELGAVDESYLAKVQKQLESKYASAGRSGSSAFGSALIGAGKDIATERTGYLAGLGYQDFQQGQGNLTAAYNNRLNQMYNQQQGSSALTGESRNRYYSQQDFNRQQAAQERLAKLSQPKSSGSFLQNLVPGLVTGAASLYGAYLGNPGRYKTTTTPPVK